MPGIRRDAIGGGALLGACAGGLRRDGGPCQCLCCSSGNQCLVNTSFDDVNGTGQEFCAGFFTVTAQRPTGFPLGATRLGRAFDVAVRLSESRVWERTRTCGAGGVQLPDPGSPAFNASGLLTAARVVTNAGGGDTATVRFRMIPAGQDPATLGPGDWRPHADLYDRVTGLPAQSWWYDPSDLVLTDTLTDEPPCGDPVPESTITQTGNGAWFALNLQNAFPVQVNDAGQVNTGPCDALGYDFAAFADAAGGLLRLPVALNTDGLFTTNDINPVVGLDGDGFPVADFCLGAAFRHQLARTGGSTQWRDIIGSAPPRVTPPTTDLTVEYNASFDASIDLDWRRSNGAWAQETELDGTVIPSSQWYPPEDDHITVFRGLTVTVVEACPGDAGLDDTCPPPGSLFLAAVPCDAAKNLAVIGYDPQNRPTDGLTLLWPPDPPENADRYRPTEIPTLAPLVPAAWSTVACGTGARLGQPCDGVGDPWPYDPSLRPPTAQSFDAGGKRYAVTDQPTGLDPMAVGAWYDDPCPADRYLAYKCKAGSLGPDTCAYALNDPLLPGQGVVTLQVVQPLYDAAGHLIGACTYHTHYRPTVVPAPAGLEVGVQGGSPATNPCAVYDAVVCYGLDPERPVDPCAAANPPIWCGRSAVPDAGPDTGPSPEGQSPEGHSPDPAFRTALARQQAYYGCSSCGG